jgi:hypothetical protein
MSDWKRVPATSANAFAVVVLGNGMLRIAFGEGLDKQENPTFHGAMLVDRRAAELLIGYIQQALAQLEGAKVGGGESGEGGLSVIMGSTSVH